MDSLILKVLLYFMKFNILYIFLHSGTSGKCLVNHGISIVDKANEEIQANVIESNSKLFTVKLERKIRTVDEYGRFHNGLRSIPFTCTQDNSFVSCFNRNDGSSIHIERCNNATDMDKKSVAHIVAVVYRKIQNNKSEDSYTTFYLTGPPTLETETYPTTDNCFNATLATELTKMTSYCGLVTESPFKPTVKCFPYEYGKNNVDYLCISDRFPEPQKIKIPITNEENQSGNLCFSTFGNGKHGHNLEKRHRGRSMISIKRKNRLKRKALKAFKIKQKHFATHFPNSE